MYLWAGFSVVVLIAILLFKEKMVHENNIDPLDIINKRYAEGEISKEEYLELQESLNSKQ
jgi:uncharacterized membrane protein